METEFERIVNVSPSRNWIKPESSRNYGITNCGVWFILKGKKGAVQFYIGTMWASKPVRDHLDKFSPNPYNDARIPKGCDLGYHSKVPMYERQSCMENNCPYTDGQCYYDGSGLQAEELVEGFLAGGTDWLWKKLEEYYRRQFEDGPYPDFTPQYLPHPDDVKATGGQ